MNYWRINLYCADWRKFSDFKSKFETKAFHLICQNEHLVDEKHMITNWILFRFRPFLATSKCMCYSLCDLDDVCFRLCCLCRSWDTGLQVRLCKGFTRSLLQSTHWFEFELLNVKKNDDNSLWFSSYTYSDKPLLCYHRARFRI